MAKDSQLKQVLEDVRAAYRLIHAYQRRVLDTVRLVGDQFSDRAFYQWTNDIGYLPPPRASSPFERGVFDFMPLYNTSFLFTKGGEGFNHPKMGDWLLEIRLMTDSDHEPFIGTTLEPTLGDVGEANSSLSLIAWNCVKTMPTNATWFHDVWEELEWPNKLKLAAGQATVLGSGHISSFQVDSPLEDIGDRDSIIRFTDAAKTSFTTTLEIKFD